jgi:hypothetical protein
MNTTRNSAYEGEQRFRDCIHKICRFTGLSADDVTRAGNITIEGTTIGLIHCGPADPFRMLAVIDLGSPGTHDAEEVYRSLLQANMVAPLMNTVLTVLPGSDHCAATSLLDLEQASAWSGEDIVAWLAGFAAVHRDGLPQTANTAAREMQFQQTMWRP